MSSTKLTLFTLASGRSGTSYLADFFAKNITQCYSTHEPYFTFGNPTLFGKPIAWNTLHNDRALLPVLECKCRFIVSRGEPFYFESNHAFLKAFNRHAGALLDNPGFIHLVRNPLLVAKSELVREQMIRKAHLPFADYTSDTGECLFRWALTGQEDLFQHIPPTLSRPLKNVFEIADARQKQAKKRSLCLINEHFESVFNTAAVTQIVFQRTVSRFQFYVLQWLEIEHRAMQLIRDNHWQDRVFFIDVDVDLKREAVLKNMVDFFGLPHMPMFNLDLRRNKTPFIGPTIITEQDKQEFKAVLRNLPDSYRELFQDKPYRDCCWFAEVNQLMADKQ